MPSKRMWVIKTPRGKILWDTVARTKMAAFDKLWPLMEDPHAREQAYRDRGYRAVRVRCVVRCREVPRRGEWRWVIRGG